MSRIGKKPIIIPAGVTITDRGDGTFLVKGPKGELCTNLIPGIGIVVSGLEIIVTPTKKTKTAGALWGLARALFANAVNGVTNGFERKLQIEGIGYKGEVKGALIVFALGFSHPIEFPLPVGITAKIEKNIITISGIDKAVVGETAAKIRALKKPEPYKGKGIRFIDEIIKIKAGKKAVGTAS
ncbi:MAG: 50S ribosomal protein L6 [Patescibacteria group bacterium]